MFGVSIQAQNYVLEGSIKDSTNQAIIGATIILKDTIGKIITYSYSNELGSYNLRTKKTGYFLLSVYSMGFLAEEVKIYISPNDSILKINFTMISKNFELKEIILESARPITIKKDTIVFDANSFRQGNEQVIEDLLKKIPGLSVFEDGTIKVGNQEVEKIMVEGDDFFDKGYKILTKNMPSESIDKIEIYKRFSNNKHLKGVENSDKVALNLILKDDFKSIWFGNINFGYDFIEFNRYDSKINLMNFGKKNKFYFLGNLNNVGNDPTGEIDHLIRPYRIDEPSSIGDNQSSNTIIGLDRDLPSLKQHRVNLNNAEMFSFNSIFSVSSKLKLKTIVFLNLDEKDYFKNKFEEFKFDNPFFFNQNFVSREKEITGFGKFDLIYDISETKSLELVTKFNFAREKNINQVLFNKDLFSETLMNTNRLIDQKITFSNKLKSNKVFLFTGRYIDEKTPQNYSVNQFTFNDLFPNSFANGTKQFSQNHMNFLGFEAHLLQRKLDEKLFEIKFGNQLRIDTLTSIFKLAFNDSILGQPLNYQNSLTYSSNNFNISTKYRFKVRDLAFFSQIELHHLYNSILDFDKHSNQSKLYVNPKAGLDWTVNEKNRIFASFSHSIVNAGILDLYSGFIQSSFRSFEKGFEGFNQLNLSNAVINYTYGSWSDKFFINSFLLYSVNHDFYSTNSLISSDFIKTEKILIKDRDLATISTSIDYYLKPIKTNLKTSFMVSNTSFKNVINGSNFRLVRNIGLTPAFELRSGFLSYFNYHLGTKWNINKVITSSQTAFSSSVSFLDLLFMINENFNFQIQTERYLFNNLRANSRPNYFLDFRVEYVLKKNKVIFSISGNNIFNNDTFRDFSISDVFVTETEYRLNPRYILFTVDFRF